MGHKAKLKQQRGHDRRAEIDEAFSFFTSGRFLGEIQRLIHDSGTNVLSSVVCVRVLCDFAAELSKHLVVAPLSVEVIGYNQVFAGCIERSGLDLKPEVVELLGQAGGRYSILGAEGHKKDEERWHGHLVLMATARGKPKIVLDIAIGRINSPEDGINLRRPIIFVAPAGFLSGEGTAVGFEVGDDGQKVCLVYRVHPHDDGFKQSEAWLKDYGVRAHDKIEFGDVSLKVPEGIEHTEDQASPDE